MKELKLTERRSENMHWKYPQWSIMQDSVLTVHVIDGRQLGANQPVLRLAVGKQHFKTKQKRGPEPIWNEDFHFEIRDGTEVLQVELWDGL